MESSSASDAAVRMNKSSSSSSSRWSVVPLSALTVTPPPPSHSFIKNTCTNTLYPSLCFRTLSSVRLDLHHHTNNHTKLHHVLQYSIHKTIKRVTKSRSRIIANRHNNNTWVDNCIELLDQTLYELQESIKPLYPPPYNLDSPPPYATIKNLLSAAMTNENTCIEGFSDNTETRLGHYFQKSLTPIMRMISNCLAIINYIETNISTPASTTTQRLLSKGAFGLDHVPSWMTAADRRLMQIPPKIIPPTVVVALDGSGNYTDITAAILDAPNRSTGRYVIQIKTGIYYENIVIPRQKANIMFVGEGMNSTIITGSKNFVDGYTTFTSATLTVIGNNFLARDLTIINTSGPEKHQAVALRVTSDAAFYHCQFISHQDTLYAHSLSQLYRECAIHGTVDFIFGNAAAIFERCLILVRKPIAGQKNVITAQGRLDPNQNTGISLQDCTIMAAPDFPVAERDNFSTFLGRPWRNYSRTIVMRSYLGDLIDPQGWCAWNKYSSLDTVEYIEYMNFGPGADTRNRVQWVGYHNNSTTDVEKFTVQSFLQGANEWLKSTDLPLCSGLYAKDCKKDSAQLHHVLQYSIHKTIKRVTKSRSRIIANRHNNNTWVDNCIELLDQTLYELQESIKPLYPPPYNLDSPPPYATIKNLLSAAMTNENTCIEGFSDNTETRLGHYFQKSLTPIMRMISNCLAIINYIETNISTPASTTTQRLLSKGAFGLDHVPSWMTAADRRLMQIPPKIIPPTVVVALDGSGNYTDITAAILDAPNRSTGRYVIQIKTGIYYENIVIPRQKANIMFVGEGMNSTIITGSKNFVDGYTTFTSATLTVIGNNFLARDLTIINTSGPEKHQAVALRVTSDAAFYHCQFISHQDTLYAHSLSQLYRECAIHGTVDFIFGNAAAIFERCLILVRKPIAGQKNVITAQGRLDPNQNTGISLQDCTIMAAPDFPVAERDNFSTFLGRPWRNYSRTIVMRSYLGDLIDPQGWCAWNKYSSLDTVEYIEYMNFGPGADTRNRVQWVGYHNNSTTDVEKFTVQSFLQGANEWLKSTDLPLCSGLYAKDCKKDSAQVY
ncbi:Pectinesterase, active site-containing protein [Artemisia annua]|uniref:pectinesterase n=1 Tax=Artemisia annua TaxID=35608 RepID=A0A2U1PIZ9_ARTAN|nr:Pectinesterase, active site-containing protein [Artemisia annua]